MPTKVNEEKVEESLEKILGPEEAGITKPESEGAEAEGEGVKPEAGKKPPAEELTVEIDGEKVPLSKVKEALSGGLREEDYSKKMGEVKEMKRQIQDFADTLQTLKQNPKKFKKFLDLLSEKEDEGEADPEEAKLFEGLDENDAYSRVMKTLYKMVKGLSGDVKGFKEKDQHFEYEEQVGQVQQVLRKTLDGLEKDLKFDGDDEKKFWRESVLSYLKDNPQDYEGTEELLATVRQVSKAVADKINRMGEARLKKYIESKSGPTPPGPGGSGTGATPKKLSYENMQEGIQAALEEAMSGKS